MTSLFDIYSVALFIAAASIFFLRFRHENPPLLPYMVISLACAVANWMGENAMAVPAMVILGAASFLLLHLTSQPYGSDLLDEDASLPNI